MTALSLAHLRLHLAPEQELHLPASNKGSTIRGGFGTAFRRLVCVDMRWECAECSLRYSCPYTTVFNPFIPPDAPQFTGNQNIPRPFVFKPPLSEQTRYAAGESLVFDLVVVGRAVEYLPYFIVSFRELGATGFGLNRARVQLARVEAIGSEGAATAVYESSTNLVRPAAPLELDVGEAARTMHDAEGSPPCDSTSPSPPPWQGGGSRSQPGRPGNGSCGSGWLSPHAANERLITLDFLTPTTLKAGSGVDRDGAIVRRPAFHHVIKRLRDRVNALATFYTAAPLSLDFKALGEAAEQVETTSDQTRWTERSRYSRRRDVPHDLSGFTGTISFRGDLAPFLPLLRIGEYVHVGKNAVFGNGWYVIKGGDGMR